MDARTGILVALLGTSVALPDPSAAADPMLSPDVGSFEERLDPSVNVSGQLLAGLMYEGAEKADVRALHVSFAESRGGKVGDSLCVRLASDDGVYAATWTATLEEPVADRARLFVDTENERELASYAGDRLVALASTGGPDCNAGDRVFLPTFWGRVPEQPGRLVLYLNSDTSDAVAAARVESGPQGTEAVRQDTCTVLDSSRTTTAFDTICRVPLEAEDTPLELIVLRENFSSPLEPLGYLLR